ncbi:MAG: zinc ABC transporter substrate-binding protein [Clostridia bacterium]|nr:zinc ABC transporter substrate-binding protein [Clostridia bacterium]
MKKIIGYISIFIALTMLPLALFSSCVGPSGDGHGIICTSFAQYDFTLNILGERADDFNVRYLLESGVDMHSYSNSMSVSDKVDILGSELFICIGGSSEKWIDGILKDSGKNGPRVIRLINEVGDTVCALDDTHGHSHENGGHESDEHIWLSPKRAAMMCEAICDGICLVDPDNSDIYRKNCENYLKKLEKLDLDYEKAFKEAGDPYLVFADRFPFIYLTEDYSIPYSAAFDGCSAESNASFETVARLVSDIKKHGVETVITLEKSRDAIADTLIKQVGDVSLKSVSVSSMQNVTKKDIANGLDYISEMEKNLEVFRKAMN